MRRGVTHHFLPTPLCRSAGCFQVRKEPELNASST
jgi:hypothetical protein